MKKTLLLFCILLTVAAFGQDYKKEWDRVIELEADGLIKSAYTAVDSIYIKSKKDNNEPQLIKSLFFRSKYLQTLDEDAQSKIISAIRKEIPSATAVTRAMLQSFYAEMLQQIYNDNSYRINERKIVDGAFSENLLTWTGKYFRDEIKKAYNESIQNRETLYAAPLEKYNAIIEVNPSIKSRGRSVYDFLIERFLNAIDDYISYSERDILQPQEHLLFGDNSEFSKLVMPDSLKSDTQKYINYHRDIEKFYSAKRDTTSLYRAILRRLDFFFDKLASPGAEKVYLNTVTQLSQSWGAHPYAYKAKLVQARLLNELADKKNNKDYKVKAVAICNTIITNSTRNDVAPEALYLKNSIVNKHLTLVTGGQVIPNKPILAKVTFKNIETFNIRVYKVMSNSNMSQLFELDAYAKTHEPILEKAYNLPQKDDYFDYTTEIILPALPIGCYILLASSAGDDIDSYGFLTLQVTQLSLVSNEQNNTTEYQILNRETGSPVPTAKVLVNAAVKSVTKDAKFTLRSTKRQESMPDEKLTIIHQTDTLNTEWRSKFYSNDEEDVNNFSANIQLYADRAIYRPGQTIFFKGIVTQYKKSKFNIVPNVYVTVTIRDASYKALKDFRLKTNEFGSFSEKWNIPSNAVTGNFSINASEDDFPEDDKKYNKRKDEHPFWDKADLSVGDLQFNVEEYKRPTFEVTFNPVKEDVVLNRETKISGTAKTFSGAAVSSAKVKYHIRCQSFTTRPFYPTGNQNSEIGHGEVATDGDGNFTITFKATPDELFNPKDLPVFSYIISTDVTDINGETRTATGTVRAAYHTMELEASLPSVVNAEETAFITVDSKNLNGQFISAIGEVAIFKIKESSSPKVDRNWDEPEIQTISQDEFERAFPNISYRKENNDSIIIGKNVFIKKVNTEKEKQINLSNFAGWEPGRYEVAFTAKDSKGNLIEKRTIFTLRRKNDVFVEAKSVFNYKILNIDSYIQDKVIKIEIQSILPQLYVHATLDWGTKLQSQGVLVKGGRAIVEFPVAKNTSPDAYLNFDCVWQNNFFNKSMFVSLVAKDEHFEFTTEVTTNKLMPGGNETWSFGIKGENPLAEVLAGMYDKSLDAFIKESWNFTLPYHADNYNDSKRELENRYNNSSLFFDNNFNKETIKKSYDYKLNTFGFNINRSKSIYVVEKLKKLQGDIRQQVTGLISDSQGFPLPGANIMIEGDEKAVQSDFDGFYSIPAAKGDRLIVAYVGMSSVKIDIKDWTINVMLNGDAKIIDDVVVEAYRAPKRYTIGSDSRIIIENNDSPEDFIRTLQGRVPGLQISTGSGQPGANSTVILRGVGSVNATVQPLYVIDGVPLSEEQFRNLNANEISSVTVLKDVGATAIYGNRGANGVIIISTKAAAKELTALQQVKARKNFNETAFFYPQIKTDKHGKFSFSFTTPEALTEWKLRMIAHNKNAASGYYENTFFTQKDLMIVPNMPRFLREKDTIVLIAKVTNLTNNVKTGNALLQLFDAATMQPADVVMMNTANLKPFTIPAKGNTTVSWKITIPKGMQGVQYKVLAKAGDFTDGEENILPVLTNSIMVTESIPLWVKPNSTKEYTYEAFEKSLSNPAITQVGMTLEYTSNPTWLALQSLPYLMEFEHECAEQVFSRYYANAIAANVINSSPKIAEVFAAWRKADKPLSKFEQNEELKSIVMAETPWILDNQSDEEIKNRLAVLFDLEKMKVSLESNFTKLQNKQAASGGFPWFEGGKESYYITRHIAAGFGHLNKLGINAANKKEIDALTLKAVKFMDSEFLKDYEYRKTYSKEYATEMPYDGLHYLYARSFYIEQYPIAENQKKIIDEYLSSVSKSTAYFKYKWLDYTLFQKGMLALALNRYGYTDVAKKVLNHLKETSSTNEEWGMYWIENKAGWYWYQAPVETQALLIEVFTEVNNDVASADAMKVWLIKNKQNKNWPTTKATTEAVYALLMQGSDWLSVKENTTFKLGDKKAFDEKLAANEKEAGTGYIKLQWKADEIKSGMGTLRIENKSALPGFGGFYWQRSYEEADKDYIPQEGPLSVSKELFVKSNTADGPFLSKHSKEKPFKIGDLVTIRLTVTAKEDMEYLHLKDMRASAFEPVDVLSQRKYQGGTSYYQSTRDVATNFFFDNLKKGVYILEYDVRINNAGDFSNGIAIIQSMYAPEFKGNSNAVRIHVEQ